MNIGIYHVNQLRLTIRFCTVFLFVFNTLDTEGQSLTLDSRTAKTLYDSHDVRLPDWGPYTKKYNGISHIADRGQGLRFDLSVFPSMYRRRRISIPDVNREADYFPWEASPDLSYFSFRHSLIWKDQLYSDISYSQFDDHTRVIEIQSVNQTEREQNIALNLIGSINPPVNPRHGLISPMEVAIPNQGIWVDAVDYTDMEFAKERPDDNLTYDGYYRGEEFDNDCVNFRKLGRNFGKDKGDYVTYDFELPDDIENAVIVFRFRASYAWHQEPIIFQCEGLIDSAIQFLGRKEYGIKKIELGPLTKGLHHLKMQARGGRNIELDGFAILPTEEENLLAFTKKEWKYEPVITRQEVKDGVILKYADASVYYGISWIHPDYYVREIHSDNLEKHFMYNHRNIDVPYLPENRQGHFTDVLLKKIIIPSKNEIVTYAMVCSGSMEEVKEKIRDFQERPNNYKRKHQQQKESLTYREPYNAGKKYAFSQKRMQATTLTNIVFPTYNQKSFNLHYTPGRLWNSLYTWDSGFVGLGLNELDKNRSLDVLNAYTTIPGSQQAFIHHGTPAPTQIYQFLDLWNQTQSRELLEYMYPRLKQYYAFLAGRAGSSTTRKNGANMIRTWDYFYNSGGWDDYPAQRYVQQNHLHKNTLPVVSTTHVIRAAKILQIAADALGNKEDIKAYEADVKDLTKGLQKNSWDDESGYFSYVTLDDEGKPNGFLRTAEGLNYNMGMDGASPLFAGVCNEEQKRILLEKLNSPKRLWTNLGITVDQAAPYSKIGSYYNETVWMAHQWFFWKGMLDLGEGEMAFKIAQKGLDVFQTETDDTYYCWEHYITETGRGKGWHHFSGLATPVLMWYGAYYLSGRITCGFETRVVNQKFSQNDTRLEATLKLFGENQSNHRIILANMKAGETYEVKWKGDAVPFRQLHGGCLEIQIPKYKGEGVLQIAPR